MMNHRTFCFLVLSVAVAAGGCQQARNFRKSDSQRLREAVEMPLHQRDSDGAMLGASVIDLDSGAVIYSENADASLIPASNAKLATTAAALDLFGPEYTFKTYLVMEGRDLWILGSGDPACGDERIAQWHDESPSTMFDQWADALKRRGITRVPGRLMYFDGAFDREYTHPLWNRAFLVENYGAPVGGLNYNENCIDVTAFPTTDGQPARLEISPANSLTNITNKTVTGGSEALVIERLADANEFTVTGGVSAEAKLESKPVTDPGAFFADALRTALKQRGIEVAGETVRADAVPFGPSGPIIDRVVAVHETSLLDVINRINKNSSNVFAGALSKALGREVMYRRGTSVAGSWALGEEAIKIFLWRNRINAGSFVNVDGSGLARENRVTANTVTQLLWVMNRHNYNQAWKDSLAIGGVDGTLADRLTDTDGQVLGKTGFVNGVRSLSGYVTSQRGRHYAFSYIYNDINGDVKPFEQTQDDAVRALYRDGVGKSRGMATPWRRDETTVAESAEPATMPTTMESTSGETMPMPAAPPMPQANRESDEPTMPAATMPAGPTTRPEPGMMQPGRAEQLRRQAKDSLKHH